MRPDHPKDPRSQSVLPCASPPVGLRPAAFPPAPGPRRVHRPAVLLPPPRPRCSARHSGRMPARHQWMPPLVASPSRPELPKDLRLPRVRRLRRRPGCRTQHPGRLVHRTPLGTLERDSPPLRGLPREPSSPADHPRASMLGVHVPQPAAAVRDTIGFLRATPPTAHRAPEGILPADGSSTVGDARGASVGNLGGQHIVRTPASGLVAASRRRLLVGSCQRLRGADASTITSLPCRSASNRSPCGMRYCPRPCHGPRLPKGAARLWWVLGHASCITAEAVRRVWIALTSATMPEGG